MSAVTNTSQTWAMFTDFRKLTKGLDMVQICSSNGVTGTNWDFINTYNSGSVLGMQLFPHGKFIHTLYIITYTITLISNTSYVDLLLILPT